MKPYQPEPLTDFTRPEESRRLEEALGQVQSELGRTYPLLIGGRR
ncbi:1-pyrroline-5-carboxylate dehydrogenase 1 [Paenibacillus konkukensis]|uniref:1-pyrroline-5-carboxylate dehydrogenase 1 n=1 Tax=Paenibacillus konkukensis TaxID=2020716 RepID=A0ABY4S0Q5_9BACL|nr:1-pyrroline-5-carboxylate dehydrogenase 1 [Paenibacillus konkukensis]